MTNLELVDSFAQKYNYTHEQVLELELEFVYSLIWLSSEQAVEAERYKDLQRKMSKLSQ